jgi:hypothetical protein
MTVMEMKIIAAAFIVCKTECECVQKFRKLNGKWKNLGIFETFGYKVV